MPSWGAVLIAVTFIAAGFAFDAGSGGKELTAVFAGAYAVGCIVAVAAVRQSGVFTAVIQPPLLLFVAVPGAYYLFHGDSIDGLKGVLINCGYPLIERFPLMFFTSAVVLLIGLVRWYVGMSARRAAPATTAETTVSEGKMSAVTAKISGLLNRQSPDDDDAAPASPPRRKTQHSIDRAARASKTAAAAAAREPRSRTAKPVKRTQPPRSRHTRPPDTEIIEPVVERPRRPRPTRRSTDAPVPPAEPRRRPRPSATGEPRKVPPAAERRSSAERRSAGERRSTGERRSSYPRPDRHSRFDGFEPFEPPGNNGSNGTTGTTNGSHHPISRVRYRGADDSDQRPEYRSTPRRSRHQADAWEYDA